MELPDDRGYDHRLKNLVVASDEIRKFEVDGGSMGNHIGKSAKEQDQA